MLGAPALLVRRAAGWTGRPDPLETADGRAACPIRGIEVPEPLVLPTTDEGREALAENVSRKILE